MKLLVTVMAVSACVALGQSGPGFEVASVKRVTSGANPGDIPRNMDNNPGHFAMYNVPLRYVIEWAYSLKDFEIVGPEWIKADERYDIVAKADGPVPADKIPLMVQALIIDRFQMKSHTEKKEISCYVLCPAKERPSLRRPPGWATDDQR
jgi:uncharacterized protein (TIGR03435 family)